MKYGLLPAIKPGKLKDGQWTEEAYKDEKGDWLPERAVWHEAPANAWIAGKTPTKEREATLLGGGTAAGKTTLSQKVLKNNDNLVRVDSDDIKLQIPEYAGLRETDAKSAARRVHEESSYLAHMIMAEPMEKKLDVFYDSTSAGKAPSASSRV